MLEIEFPRLITSLGLFRRSQIPRSGIWLGSILRHEASLVQKNRASQVRSVQKANGFRRDLWNYFGSASIVSVHT